MSGENPEVEFIGGKEQSSDSEIDPNDIKDTGNALTTIGSPGDIMVVADTNAEDDKVPTQELRMSLPCSQACPGLDVPLVTEGFNDLSLEEAEVKIREAKELFELKKEELGTNMPNNCMIWIATDVTKETFEKILNFGRFLFKDENLFLRKGPNGACHGCISAEVIGEIGSLRNNTHGLTYRDIKIAAAAIDNYGGENCEPDVGMHVVSDGKLVPRVIFEIEVEHRSTPGSLEQVERYFREQNVGAVVLIKVWPRGVHNTFAAAAVFWVKNYANDTIECVECHDFGSRAIEPLARNNFAREVAPNVPQNMEFQTPNTLHPLQREAHLLSIPAGVVTRNANNSEGTPLANLQINNLTLDLSRYAYMIEDNLGGFNGQVVEDN